MSGKNFYLHEELTGWLFFPELIPDAFFRRVRRRASRDELLLAIKCEIARSEGDEERFDYWVRRLRELL